MPARVHRIDGLDDPDLRCVSRFELNRHMTNIDEPLAVEAVLAAAGTLRRGAAHAAFGCITQFGQLR
ncbi:MAG: hypothetical protein HC809_03165 [Gammaproteobacteria bacterium]|nr:hypothetical protein [Gammaproteobacteria bacterium]